MDNAEIKKRIKQNRFAANNGMVLRTVHMLGEKYTGLEDLRYGLEPSMSESELTDCLNYLARSGYVELRDIRSHEVKHLSDADFEQLEVVITPKGVQLLYGRSSDPCIDV